MYLSKENHLCYKQEHLEHCFPVRIELVFERNTSCNLDVSGWRSALLAPNRLSWRNTCISPQNYQCYKLHYLAHWFLMRIEWVVKGRLPATWVFQCGDRLSFFHIGLFSWVDETHVSPERNPFMLEAVASSTLFPCEIWVSFWKEYFLQLRCFKVMIGSYCSKYAYSSELKKHMHLSKENHLC
jgi:hypothetical protein